MLIQNQIDVTEISATGFQEQWHIIFQCRSYKSM